MIQIILTRPKQKYFTDQILLLVSDKKWTLCMFPSLWLKQITEKDVFLNSSPLVFSIAFYGTAHIPDFQNKFVSATRKLFYSKLYTKCDMFVLTYLYSLHCTHFYTLMLSFNIFPHFWQTGNLINMFSIL